MRIGHLQSVEVHFNHVFPFVAYGMTDRLKSIRRNNLGWRKVFENTADLARRCMGIAFHDGFDRVALHHAQELGLVLFVSIQSMHIRLLHNDTTIGFYDANHSITFASISQCTLVSRHLKKFV